MRTTLLLLLLGNAAAFMTRPIRARRVPRFELSASVADEVTATVHGTLFDTVNADLGLKLTDFTEVYGAKTWSTSEWSGSTVWYDEAKGSKLTGVSKNSVTGGGETFSRTLNVWMGPGYTVPHLLLTVGGGASGLYVAADYVPRGPTPLGSDQTYLDTYFTAKDVLEAYDGALKLPGAVPLAPPASFYARLLRSPVAVAVGGLSSADASAIATAHVSRWLAWLKEAKPVEARQRGAINTRDDKQRQFFYRAAVTDSTALVGPELGKTVGACSTGPVAEAYVGGGS